MNRSSDSRSRRASTSDKLQNSRFSSCNHTREPDFRDEFHCQSSIETIVLIRQAEFLRPSEGDIVESTSSLAVFTGCMAGCYRRMNSSGDH